MKDACATLILDITIVIFTIHILIKIKIYFNLSFIYHFINSTNSRRSPSVGISAPAARAGFGGCNKGSSFPSYNTRIP